LFALDFDLLLYDVTSTYFEGQAESNGLARRRCSRDNVEFLRKQQRRYIVGTPKPVLRRFERKLLVPQWEQGRERLNVQRCRSIVPVDCAGRRMATRCSSRIGANNGWRRTARSYGASISGSISGNVTDWTPEEFWHALHAVDRCRGGVPNSEKRLKPAAGVASKIRTRAGGHSAVLSVLGALSSVLWKTLGQLCAQAGLGREPRTVFAENFDIAMVEVLMPTRTGQTIAKHCAAKLTPHQAILPQRLALRLPSSFGRHQM
jgi:hypothetical protein